MSVAATIFTNDIGDVLAAAFARAKTRVTVVTPFITRSAFDRLMKSIQPGVPVEVITRWLPEDVAQGVSDPSILDYRSLRGYFTVGLVNTLHAKSYIVDDVVAFVGSANLTNAGLGFETCLNVEVMVRLTPVPTMLLALIQRLRRKAIPATQELRDAIEEAANTRRGALPELVDDTGIDWRSTMPVTEVRWSPACRFPNRLYAAYRSLDSVPAATQATALEDLSWICCQENLTEREFHSTVRDWLLSQPIIGQLDSILHRPRRFGELATWLKRQLPESCPDTRAAKRRAQTLVRWLLFFGGDKYRVTQRRYTEVLSRRDNGEP